MFKVTYLHNSNKIHSCHFSLFPSILPSLSHFSQSLGCMLLWRRLMLRTVLYSVAFTCIFTIQILFHFKEVESLKRVSIHRALNNITLQTTAQEQWFKIIDISKEHSCFSTSEQQYIKVCDFKTHQQQLVTETCTLLENILDVR
jgi:ABC-type multidrug transport system permease subunit